MTEKCCFVYTISAENNLEGGPGASIKQLMKVCSRPLRSLCVAAHATKKPLCTASPFIYSEHKKTPFSTNFLHNVIGKSIPRLGKNVEQKEKAGSHLVLLCLEKECD